MADVNRLILKYAYPITFVILAILAWAAYLGGEGQALFAFPHPSCASLPSPRRRGAVMSRPPTGWRSRYSSPHFVADAPMLFVIFAP